VAGHRKGFEDTRGTLFFDVARIAQYHKPKMIFLENVKGFVWHDRGNTFKIVKETLEDMGYKVFYQVLNAKDYGVPQNRERIYIICFLGDIITFRFPDKINKQTKVFDILERHVDEKYTISDRLWAGHQRRKIEHKQKGNGFGYSLFDENSSYTSTISARYYKDGSEILIKQNDKNPRKLTPREAARLQGFSDDFKITVSDAQAYRQFGNSVAVPVIEELARIIYKTWESRMKLEKLTIHKNKFDLNLKFYFFLKYLLKASLNDNDIRKLLELHSLNKGLSFKKAVLKKLDSLYGTTKSGLKKQGFMTDIFDVMDRDFDSELFIFSLKLYAIKPLLLQEAKTRDLLDTSKLESLSPLSLEYDKVTLFNPYSTRVSGALLSLIFFDKLENNDPVFLSSDTTDFLSQLSKDAIKLKDAGVEPNQIFMLMFSESVNQSIISDSGSNYEDRILSVLKNIGIDEDKIKKTHDEKDTSTEFDFFFELNKKTYGIGAKRTLRERYKQFIKTAQMSTIDVMIEITLGIDLTEEKAIAIREHGVYLFVADEIYASCDYLQNIDGIYSTKELTKKTLLDMAAKV
jgi:hypothetical protein